MTDKYGTQTYQIEKMLEQIKNLTLEEITKIHEIAGWDGGWPEVLPAAWGAAYDAGCTDDWHAAWEGALNSAWHEATKELWPEAWNDRWYLGKDADWDDWPEVWPAGCPEGWDEAKDAVDNAVLAMEARHLIGQYGFTLEHYNLLTKPWRDVIGEFEEQPLLP